MNTALFKWLRYSVEFDVQMEPMQEPVECFGYDPEVTADILSLKERSDWGWCCVSVSAVFNGIRGEPAVLGAVSYEDEFSFRCSCPDIFDEAVDNLARKLIDAHRVVAAFLESKAE